MEAKDRKWLHGRHVPVRNYRYVFKPRPFEEMSDPGNSSIGIRDDSHSGKNGYDDENGYATKDGDDDENGQDGVKAYDNENGYDGEDEDNSVIRTGDANVNEHADENDHASENGYVGENGTQATSSSKLLPGCSKGKDHIQPWHMSVHHMKAFLVMKGRNGPDADDALLTWMAEHAEEKPNVKGMFGAAKASMKMDFDWKTEGPAKYDEEDETRPTSYKYPRPKIDHLGVPAMLDPKCLDEMLEAHKKAGGGWSQFVNDYCSDDEDDPANGRISPCTFARWAEGAGEKKYCNFGDRFKSVVEDPKHFEIPEHRQRPKSPNTIEPRFKKTRNKESQQDERTGDKMSPICSEYADTQPSILWSPPPMKAAIPQSAQKHGMYRMDPELAVALREGHKDVILGNADSFGADEPNEGNEIALAADFQQLQFDEVKGVVAKYWGSEPVFEEMAEKQRALAHLAHNEHLISSANEHFDRAATALKHDNRRLADCLKKHKHDREMRIMRHVDQQMRELEYEGMSKMAEIESQVKVSESLRRQVENEQAKQAKLLAEFGKKTPEEVFSMFPNVWDPLEKRKNYRNYS